LPFSYQTIRRYMLTARRCGPFAGVLDRFSVDAARVLSRRQVAESPRLQQALLQLAETHDGCGLIGEAAARDAISSIEPTVFYPRDELTPAEKFVRNLDALMSDESVSFITISLDHDDVDPSVSLSVLGSQRRSVTKRSVSAAVAALVGDGERKQCSKCKQWHLGSDFYPNRRSCKWCERKRTSINDRNKRRRERERKQAQTQAQVKASPPHSSRAARPAPGRG